MNELEEAFFARLTTYAKETKKILLRIPHVLEGIVITLTKEEEQSTLEWEDVQYMHEEGIVVIVGNILLKVGDSFKLENGKSVTVTEENVAAFRRVIRVGIPISLAQDGTTQDVVDFLVGKRQKNYVSGEGMTDTGDTEIRLADSNGEKEQPVSGFDLNDLTEEQIEQLMLLKSSEKLN